MLSKRTFFAVAICSFAATHAFAGVSMHYSGKASQRSGKSFNFAVSSTNPTMLGSNPDSPSEPVLDNFFPRLLELRDFSGVGSFARFQAATMLGGGSDSNEAKSGRFARLGSAGSGNKSGIGGGGAGGLPSGSHTTSGDQSVNGTGGIVCGPRDDDDDSGGSTGGGPDDGDDDDGDDDDDGRDDDGGDDDGGDDDGGDDDGGGGPPPNPSAVPEPSGLALWSIVTGLLVFGTRRTARR